MHRKALGKGLDALFKSSEEHTDEKQTGRRILLVPLNDIIPNSEQPRERFSEETMEELKRSIAENGILEPPIVRRKGDFFELIAGERRYRAARELKLDSIEVIVMEVKAEEQMLILSLIENIQREDLNAVEEAKAYEQIQNRMQSTQDDLARIVGKSRSAVANTLRLLSLTERVQDMVREGVLAPGSARALVTVSDAELQHRLAVKISSEGLSARKAEELVKHTLKKSEKPIPSKVKSLFLEQIGEDLQRLFGTVVKIKGDEIKGKLEIEYYSQDDLERILDIVKGSKALF
ncbi:MAG: ParB/RepB/Spo0J family partition protein [Candidatus Latescibacter sp.]|nr:ParB/RepB/Spo0J family partition protein [Candidatus Latescibacter sp.]